MKLTNNQIMILRFLRKHKSGHVSPTEIGQKVRGPKFHSAWASPICHRLRDKGLVWRDLTGHYQISDAGLVQVQGRRV